MNHFSFGCTSLDEQRAEMRKQKLTPADPTDEDVLCGSGRVVIEHPGNIRFQRLVSQKYPNYIEADSKNSKTRVTTEALFEVLSTGARFLKKHPIYNLWYICLKQKKVGRDKISHLLRQMSRRPGSAPLQGHPQREYNNHDQEQHQQVQNNHQQVPQQMPQLELNLQQQRQQRIVSDAGSIEEQIAPFIQLLADYQPHVRHAISSSVAGNDQERLVPSGLMNVAMRNSFVLCSAFHVRTIEEMMVESSSAPPSEKDQQKSVSSVMMVESSSTSDLDQQKPKPGASPTKSLLDEMFQGLLPPERYSPDARAQPSKAKIQDDVGEREHLSDGSGPELSSVIKNTQSSLPNFIINGAMLNVEQV